MCGGGAARVEESGELGRWPRERPSPGSAAVRKRSGAEGKMFAESVPAGAECDVGAAAEAAMAGFLLLEILVFILGLWGARGGERSAENSRGVRGFREESGGRRLGSFSRSRFVTCIWAGKSFALGIEPDTVGGIIFKRSYAGSGWDGEGKL